MSAYETIVCETQGPLAWIRFNRPRVHNAMNMQCLHETAAALDAAAADPAVRVVALVGNGGKAFTAGADISELSDRTPFEMLTYNRLWLDLFDRIEAMPKPVVAGVHGWATGGGTELSLCCDFVVCSEAARFGLAEINIGVIPGAGAAVRLTRWVGRLKAKEILMLGELIPGPEAVALHLANRCVPDGALEDAVRELAGKLASKAPLALAAAKSSVNVGGEMPQPLGLEYELREFLLLFGTEDQKEGMRAFLEKRPARYVGR
ncbi:enoyl-CoA hydratase/isomerase family protein [Azospirillum sp.]|uniref:enoyl-CoA hydratase/isomerase family protein n=1 Tax=Azospirillum sp. TaxID=34012 RepID=UPI003D716F4F